MDETKVELFAQLGEISVMLGKLTDEKKLKNVSKKVKNLHSLLKRKKNKTIKKNKKKSVTFSDISESEPMDISESEPMDISESIYSMSESDPIFPMDMSNESPMDSDPPDNFNNSNISESDPLIIDSDMETPNSVLSVLSDPDKNLNKEFSDSLTDRYA